MLLAPHAHPRPARSEACSRSHDLSSLAARAGLVARRRAASLTAAATNPAQRAAATSHAALALISRAGCCVLVLAQHFLLIAMGRWPDEVQLLDADGDVNVTAFLYLFTFVAIVLWTCLQVVVAVLLDNFLAGPPPPPLALSAFWVVVQRAACSVQRARCRMQGFEVQGPRLETRV
eukprot:1032651-Rhodomonas_salina.2